MQVLYVSPCSILFDHIDSGKISVQFKVQASLCGATMQVFYVNPCSILFVHNDSFKLALKFEV